LGGRKIQPPCGFGFDFSNRLAGTELGSYRKLNVEFEPLRLSFQRTWSPEHFGFVFSRPFTGEIGFVP
jgi:hypothetical protein